MLADILESQATAPAVTPTSMMGLAGVYLALGDTDAALDSLERAYDRHVFTASFFSESGPCSSRSTPSRVSSRSSRS